VPGIQGDMLRVSHRIAAPAERVWDVLTDPVCWPRWGPSVSAVEVSDRPIRSGSRGRIQTSARVWLPFEVTALSEGRYWRWRVAGVPATGHRVEPLDEHRSRLTFEVPWLAAPYGLVCALAARRIASLCEPRAPTASVL
jgi:uncharacterized protein YndB with AHSA1/START domain